MAMEKNEQVARLELELKDLRQAKSTLEKTLLEATDRHRMELQDRNGALCDGVRNAKLQMEKTLREAEDRHSMGLQDRDGALRQDLRNAKLQQEKTLREAENRHRIELYDLDDAFRDDLRNAKLQMEKTLRETKDRHRTELQDRDDALRQTLLNAKLMLERTIHEAEEKHRTELRARDDTLSDVAPIMCNPVDLRNAKLQLEKTLRETEDRHRTELQDCDDALRQLELEKNGQIARLELELKHLRERYNQERARHKPKPKISFFTEVDCSGKEEKVEAVGDTHEVPKVPEHVASGAINVYEGKWIAYTEINFIGWSFLLRPGEYKGPEVMKKMIQGLGTGQEWTGQLRSLRLVAEGGMMLFDQDNFRGNCKIIKETTEGIDFKAESMIIELNPNFIARKHPQVDLVFVLDGSASIGTNDFVKIKQFTVKMLRGLYISPTTTRIGVVQYSKDVTLEFKLADHGDKDSVEKAINRVQYQMGNTLTGKALTFVRTAMDWRARESAKRVVIVLTDGKADDDVATPAEALRQDGFVVYAVGVGPTPNDLTPMVSDKGKVTSLNNFDKLEGEIDVMSEGVSRDAEWAVYNHEGFKGEKWQAYPGFYTSDDLEKNLGGRVGSAKRLV